MRISKGTVILVASMLLLSIFVANMVNVLTTTEVAGKTRNKDAHLNVTNSNDHLIWFLQISDTHLSSFKDLRRVRDLRHFSCRTIDVIQPSVVVASGDLTDARSEVGVGSQQLEKEWRYYWDILSECRVGEKTVWLDIRGNHDTFNVAGLDSEQNYFARYSMQGRHNPRSYLHQIRRGSETYSFIAVDTTLVLGPRIPYNFAGNLGQKQIDDVNSLIAKSKSSNYSVWFGHYPTSCVVSTGNQTITDLIQSDANALVYLCGHFHTAEGIIPKMYTLQKGGFLELELGDWKTKRMYRLVAIDHGMLSFVDVTHGKWPVGVITNPKHALFVNTAKEDLGRIKGSTHIRVLAFSLDEITIVRVRINGGRWMDLTRVDGPLYVVKWNPRNYLSGVHTIELHIKDAHGRETSHSQPFAMDDTRLSFSFLARLTLMVNTRTIFQTLFFVTVFGCTLPLLTLRFLHKIMNEKKMSRLALRGGCCTIMLRKWWLLCTVDRLFWPLILYPVYLSIGPWSIGYVVEDHLGAVFAWGILVNWSYLPGSFTYFYGYFQLLIFQLPLTFILAHCVNGSFQCKLINPRKPMTRCSRISLHLPFFLFFSVHFVLAVFFGVAHGAVNFFVGPLRTWSLVLACFLWYSAVYLPEKCTRRAAEFLQIGPNSENGAATELRKE